MIYKGIVESVNGTRARVRIPTLHKSESAIGSLQVGKRCEACICTIPGIAPNLQVKDIVFVEFEDTLDESPVILGTLYGFTTTSKSNISVNDIIVNVTSRLPKDTEIGDIKYSHINKLSGITYNIQNKFDELVTVNERQSSKIAELEQTLKDLYSEVKKLKDSETEV